MPKKNRNDDKKPLLNEAEFANDNIKKYYAKDENFEQPKNEIPPLDPKDSNSLGSTLYRLFRYMFNKKK